MKSARVSFVVSFCLALVAACSSGASGPGFDVDGGSFSSSSGTTGGGSSSGGTAPTATDSGIPCGMQGACTPPQECCFASQFAPTCAAPGSCSASSLACSSTQHCSGGQVCCFAFNASDGGMAGAGGFAAPGAAGFNAQCASQCPTGDMVHYQLCASASDCPGGQSCIRGTYTTYCAAPLEAGAFPGFREGGAFPFGGRDAGGD